jgi:hypothetical protein
MVSPFIEAYAGRVRGKWKDDGRGSERRKEEKSPCYG